MERLPCSSTDRLIHMDWIVEQWDKMGQFYASLEHGHATASTALKRLVGFSEKNHFYRANRELGRILKLKIFWNTCVIRCYAKTVAVVY